MTKTKNKSHEKGDNKIGKKLFMTSTYLLIYMNIYVYIVYMYILANTYAFKRNKREKRSSTYIFTCMCM